MPYADKAKSRAHGAARYALIKSDPNRIAEKNAAERGRYRIAMQNEAKAEQIRARARKWRAKNPEKMKRIGKKANLKRYYGITPEQHAAMIATQVGACAICRRSPTTKGLAVDHDHVSGHVRGLLCVNCNHLLGKAKEDVTILRAAIDYLNEFSWGGT